MARAQWWYVPEGKCSMCGRVPVSVIVSDAAGEDDVAAVCLDCAAEVRDLLDGALEREPFEEFACPVEEE